MDSPRQQRSISLCQPHSTTPHPSHVGVPTRLPDPLGCRPSTAGGQGSTLSTFPLVPLTHEPTCTPAIDPGISRSTLTPADTSPPSRSSGHFPDFPWSGSPWLAHGSPLHGDWFPNPTGLLLGAFGLPTHPMSHSPWPHPGTGPFPASHGLPTPSGRCAALATRPSPPRSLVPSSRVYTPPGRLQACGAGLLDPLPSGDRFVRLARVAPFPPPSLSLVPWPRSNPHGCCAAPSHPSSRVYTPPGRQQPCGAGPLDPHPSGDRFVRVARVAPLPPPPLTPVPPPVAHRLGRAPLRPRCSNPGRLFVVFSQLPRTLLSLAPGSPPDDPVRGLGPCSTPPRMLPSGASFCRILSFASDAPVRGLVPCFILPRMLRSGASFYRILSVASDAPLHGTWFTPGQSSPGACAVLHSAPVAPIRGVFLSYSLRCLGCSCPWHRVLPRTIQSGGLGRAPLRPSCSNPGRPLIVFSPLPQMLQSGASFCRFLSVAWDAPVRGTWFTPGQSNPGAWAVLHSAPVAPIQGVFLSYSLRCLGCSCPWHRVLPRTIQSGGLGRAPLRPGCSNPGRQLIVFSPLPQMLQSGASFCRILSVASDAPVRGTGFTPGQSSPGASAVLLSAPVAPIRGVFLSYSLRCLGCSSPWHLVHPQTIQSGG